MNDGIAILLAGVTVIAMSTFMAFLLNRPAYLRAELSGLVEHVRGPVPYELYQRLEQRIVARHRRHGALMIGIGLLTVATAASTHSFTPVSVFIMSLGAFMALGRALPAIAARSAASGPGRPQLRYASSRPVRIGDVVRLPVAIAGLITVAALASTESLLALAAADRHVPALIEIALMVGGLVVIWAGAGVLAVRATRGSGPALDPVELEVVVLLRRRGVSDLSMVAWLMTLTTFFVIDRDLIHPGSWFDHGPLQLLAVGLVVVLLVLMVCCQRDDPYRAPKVSRPPQPTWR